MSPADAVGVGFFGKVPALGDFVSRRLPRHFIEPWDQWLQASMRSSQETLGDKWLSLFLVSPIWRFALNAGVCGPNSWAGVMMPSVDRVGRYYPLTLAREMPAEAISTLFLPESEWFSRLEAAALSVLDEYFDLDSFDKGLADIDAMDNAWPVYFQTQATDRTEPAGNKRAFRFDLDALDQTPILFPRLAICLLERFLPGFSLWASDGVHLSRPNFLCCEGMPPIDAYADFLQGVPKASKAWHLQSYQQVQCAAPKKFPDSLASKGQAVVLQTDDPKSTIWRSHGLTVVGNKRAHNEDAVLDCPGLGLWVVADGMGGHQSGDFASRLVVDSLSGMIPAENLDDWVGLVCNQLIKVNKELRQYASELQQGSIVGTTVVALLAREEQCAVIWAGDSRLYRLRDGGFEKLTRDHTLIDELMDSGLISREAATQQIGANVITRAVGGQEDLALDVIRFRAAIGDRYLLCSDGLDKELTESEIAQLIAKGSCQAVAEALIDTALSRSGRDNITVVVAKFDRRD